MEDLTKLSVDDFLDQVADRTPIPGGGSVAAAAGALACAMARMVAAWSLKKNVGPDDRARIESATAELRRADQLLRALITEDAEVYTQLTAAGKAGDTPGERSAHQQAILKAIGVPMQMAAVASAALAVMNEFKAVANRYLLSDLGVAAVLAEATASAAAYSVRVNARRLDDAEARPRTLAEIDGSVEHCRQHRRAIEGYVRDHLEGGPA